MVRSVSAGMCPQLSASRRDIISPAFPNDTRDVLVEKDRAEMVDLFVTRFSEFQLRCFVEGNEVDLAGDAPYKAGKTKGIPRGIVDAIDENVFEGNPLPRAEGKPPADRQDLLQGMGFIDGHEKASSVIISGVEGNG